MDDCNYLVSVYMTTYYHEKYVKRAIDSILEQKTDFKVQIVISDDCSEDGTISILKEYEKTHGNIKLLLNETNIGLTANMHKARTMCDGEYITAIAGDDYWIDNYKLKKQVEFLKNYPEYCCVCCRVEKREDDNEYGSEVVPGKKMVGPFCLNDFLRGKNLPLNGYMMRNPKYTGHEEMFSIMPLVSKYVDDLTDNYLILKLGNAYILEDIMTIYRVRRKTTGDKNFNSIQKNLSMYNKHIELLNNLQNYVGQDDLFFRYKKTVCGGFKRALKTRMLNDFFETYRTIPKKYRNRGLLIRSIIHVPVSLINLSFSK